MKTLTQVGLALVIQFCGIQAYAFQAQEQFKIEVVKPWGELGFRAIGRGKTITEMRFNCGKASDMGLVLEVVNTYGKTSSIVLPATQLGSTEKECHRNLKKYFAGVYSRRKLASHKDKTINKSVRLNINQGGLFSDLPNSKTLSFF